MFRKLVANLPFNPSLINQVSFYYTRLKQEHAVRRLGFLFMAFAMLIQMAAVIVPPERSLASSSNHIIDGIRTRDDILNAWDQPNSDIPDIYGSFGITRNDIASLSKKPDTTIQSDSADYWTIGRNSLNGYSGVNEVHKDSQISVQYKGHHTPESSDDRFVYQRRLKAWDIRNPSNKYKSFKGKIAKTGETFWIMSDCGNLTKIGKKKAPPGKTPSLKIRKSTKDNPEYLKPGDTLTYNLAYRNPVTDTVAENVVIEDQLDLNYFSLAEKPPFPVIDGLVRYEVGSLPYSADYKVLSLKLQLKSQLTSGSQVCNTAKITSSNADQKTSNQVCVGIIVPCPFDDTIANSNNPNCVEPEIVCSVVDATIEQATKIASFHTIVSSTNADNTIVERYVYDFGDGETGTSISERQEDNMQHAYKAGNYEAQVTVYFTTTGQTGAEDKSATCVAQINAEEDQALGRSKTVENISQSKDAEDAISSVVEANDMLEYTLTTTNLQNYESSSNTVTDYVGDILDYAVLDEAFLKEQGGTFDQASKVIKWQNTTIDANSSVEHKFRVTVKNPIPSTNAPSSVTTNYDCKISNQYGNEITMNVNCPLVKGLETLPNTGPGPSLLISMGITTIIGYFYARSRLFVKEINLIRSDYAVTGGM